MQRRRHVKGDHNDDVQNTTRVDSSSETTPQPKSIRPKSDRKESFITKPKSKRRNGLIFMLGGVFGILCAVFFAQQQDVISLDSLMDLNIDSLMDVIPQSIMRDAREFSVCNWYRELNLNRVVLMVDYSNMNAKQSVTMHSPSA